jgi:thiol-disulfide isomerase/thioredoxin
MTKRILGGLVIATALVAGHGAAEARDPVALPVFGSAAPWMGVSMDTTNGNGVGVAHVVRGSPADKGGVKNGDRLVVVDGTKVASPADVTRAVQAHKIGDSVPVEVERAGSSVKSQLVLAARPSGDEMLRMDLVGTFAPAWTNVTIPTGAPASLASLKGRVVIVDFWATWCGPCKMIVPRLSALKDKLGAQGLSVVGVTTDEEQKAADYASKNQMRYPSVIDKDGDTSRAYGISGLPTMLVLDKRGVVREVFVGFDPSADAKLEALVKTLLAEPVPGAAAAPAPAASR